MADIVNALEALTALVTVLFAGWIAVKQLPQIHREVNGNLLQATDDLIAARDVLRRHGVPSDRLDEEIRRRKELASPQPPAGDLS